MIACEPVVGMNDGDVALPVLSSATVARIVEPSMNWTLPVGVPDPGAAADTAAVNVMPWPKTAGLADDVSDVVVESRSTVWVTAPTCWR